MRTTPKIVKTPATASAIDEDALISASWEALDEAEKLDLTKSERSALNTKIIASAVFGVDIDGVIGSLTRTRGQSRTRLLKIFQGDDVNARINSRPGHSATTID